MKPLGPFTTELWKSIEDIFETIVMHPFCHGLAEGTLAPEVFKRYLGQDILYIVEDSRALAATAAHAPNETEMRFLLKLAMENLDVERYLHDELLKIFDARPVATMNAACAAYTTHLVTTALSKHYEESLAALLPCFWLYRETGMAICNQAVTDNPYQLWLDTYSGAEFEAITWEFISLTEQAAARSTDELRATMRQAFVQSSRYELAFFEAVM